MEMGKTARRHLLGERGEGGTVFFPNMEATTRGRNPMPLIRLRLPQRDSGGCQCQLAENANPNQK
jgi:hypothetical protein